jgi:hypothetical protein
MQFAGAWFERYSTVAVAIQAVIALWTAEGIGIVWTEPEARDPARSVRFRAALGALLGALPAALVVLFSLTTRAAALERSPPAVELLAVGLLAAAFGAVRDELLLRGVMLRLARGVLPPWSALLLCGVAAAAARFGTAGAAGVALAAEAFRGVALAGLWVRDRGAWMACAANAAWALVLGPVTHGGLLDVRFAAEADTGGHALAVAAVAGVAAVCASLWALLPARARLR